MHLSIKRNMSVEGSRSVCLLVCVAITAFGAELFHRLVDSPSKALAHIVFDWIRK